MTVTFCLMPGFAVPTVKDDVMSCSQNLLTGQNITIRCCQSKALMKLLQKPFNALVETCAVRFEEQSNTSLVHSSSFADFLAPQAA